MIDVSCRSSSSIEIMQILSGTFCIIAGLFKANCREYTQELILHLINHNNAWAYNDINHDTQDYILFSFHISLKKQKVRACTIRAR